LRLTALPGVDLVQEKVFNQGPQNNESAMEQAKDEQISDFIREKYKSATGSDFPVSWDARSSPFECWAKNYAGGEDITATGHIRSKTSIPSAQLRPICLKDHLNT
jgi:hypothetical protein